MRKAYESVFNDIGCKDTKRDDMTFNVMTDPLFRKCLEDHAAKDARIERLKEALRSIVKHQEIAGGNLSELSATSRIALNALDESPPSKVCECNGFKMLYWHDYWFCPHMCFDGEEVDVERHIAWQELNELPSYLCKYARWEG
jgi:hypothetical protein